MTSQTIKSEARSIQRDGRTLAYRVFGEGKPLVVLMHGWMTDGRIYEHLLEHLDLAHARFVVPDLAGHGGSAAAGEPSLPAFADDVLAIASKEDAGGAGFVLVGHSMAGQIASLAAAKAGKALRGLVLLCPVPVDGLPLPPDAAGLFSSSGEDRGKQGTILGLACTHLSDVKKEWMLDVAGAIPKATISSVFSAWSTGSQEDILATITARALVVATDDPFLPPAFLTAKYVSVLPQGRLVLLPDAGHYPQVERPRETAAILGAFLAGLALRPPAVAWQISFTYLHDHDAVLASFIGVELATLADVVRWVREVDIRMGTFGRKFDLLIDLTGLVVKPSAAAEFGRRRAEVLSKHTLSSFRFGGDRPTVTSVYTSSVLYKAAANHHATLDDAILALKKDRESRISRPR